MDTNALVNNLHEETTRRCDTRQIGDPDDPAVRIALEVSAEVISTMDEAGAKAVNTAWRRVDDLQARVIVADEALRALNTPHEELVIAVLRHSPDGRWRDLTLDDVVEIVAGVLRGEQERLDGE